MNSRQLRLLALACLLVFGCSYAGERHLLAVGGTHTFAKRAPCKLVRSEPADAVSDLAWAGTLALEAKSEGTAEVRCGVEKIILDIVTPARVEVEVVDGGPVEVAIHKRFKARARLYDRQARELEVGKYTVLEWRSSDILAAANNGSSGEFGFCDTCHGRYDFQALRPGRGWISAHLGSLAGLLELTAIP